MLRQELREARDTDGPAIIDIVQQVFARYGVIFDLDELPDLARFASSAQAHDGCAFVFEVDDAVVGCVAIEPTANAVEVHRLYVLPAHWGGTVGHALMTAAEQVAQARGAPAIELWSDVKFDRAHRFYERRGYLRGAITRELHDRSATLECFYRLLLKTE